MKAQNQLYPSIDHHTYSFPLTHISNSSVYPRNGKGKEYFLQPPGNRKYIVKILALHVVPWALGINHSGLPYPANPSTGEAFLIG